MQEIKSLKSSISQTLKLKKLQRQQTDILISALPIVSKTLLLYTQEKQLQLESLSVEKEKITRISLLLLTILSKKKNYGG